jgi:hypothetical protein
LSFNPGDVVVDYCLISGYKGTVDISRRIKEFSVFEHILKPYTTCEMTLIDNADVIDYNVGLDGYNTLSLSFHQPGQAPYILNHVVMVAEKIRNTENLRTAIVKIVSHSPQMTSLPKVQKSYKDMTATSIAADLIHTFLRINKPLVIKAPSRSMLGNGRMPYNINGLGIFQAIKSTLKRAASTTDTSSAYTFFENNRHMVIDTLERMSNDAARTSVATYYQRPHGKDWHLDVANQPWTIFNLKEEKRVDRTVGAQYDQQSTRTLDQFSNAFKGKGGGAGSYLNIPYNIQRPPTFMQNVLGPRQRAAAEFDAQSVTILVALNPEVTPGLGFTIETMAPAGDLSSGGNLDRISGPVLCTEVRHQVKVNDSKMQATTTCKGTKGTLGLNGFNYFQ